MDKPTFRTLVQRLDRPECRVYERTVKPQMLVPTRSEAARVAMLAALLVFGAWLFKAPPAEALPAAFCLASDKEPRSLGCNLGLELWEEGKKSETMFQLWELHCFEGVGHKTECTLERTQIVASSEYGGFTTIHRHSTSEGSLKVWELDLPNGKLSFDVVYPRGERMPVLIQLKKPVVKGSSYHIETFQAKDVVRTTFPVSAVVSTEWRIPEYSYTRNVPIALLGRKDADEKERDDLMKRLSTTDRQAWERSESSCVYYPSPNWFDQEPLKRLLAPQKRKLEELERQMGEALGTPRFFELAAERDSIWKGLYQKEEVKTLLKDKMRQCLAEAGMSKGGAELASSYLQLRSVR